MPACHVREMSRDRFSVPLHCPNCHREGTAKLSQADGWAYAKGNRDTSIEEMPEGFSPAAGSNHYTADMDIICIQCGVSAVKPIFRPLA